MAKTIGADETTTYDWENNRGRPIIKFIPTIIEFLDYVPYDVSSLSSRERLNIAHQSHGLTGRELANQLGIDPSTFYPWEKDEHKPIRNCGRG